MCILPANGWFGCDVLRQPLNLHWNSLCTSVAVSGFASLSVPLPPPPSPPHTQLTLSLNRCPLARVFTPRPYPTRTTHNTPPVLYICNNSSNLHLYMGHFCTHAHWSFFFSVYFYFCCNLLSNIFIIIGFITLIICCLYFVYWKLLTPRQTPCVCKHTWQ